MIKPGEYTGAFLFILSIFLVLDAFLTFVMGERYKYWGLEYMPSWYRNLMLKIYKSPGPLLCLLILAEFIIGSGIFLLVLKSMTQPD